MNTADAVRRDYRVAFLSYLPSREEKALNAGYEIGRTAVIEGISILELSKIHHEVFRMTLSDTAVDELDDVVDAASEFFLEVMATYHMTHGSTGSSAAGPTGGWGR